MEVLFLDVDGVLNCSMTKTRTENGYLFVEDIFLERVRRIVETIHPYIVLNSTWANDIVYDTEDGRALIAKFAEFGLEIFDVIPYVNGTSKGSRIETYLNQNPAFDNFVIIDDYDDMEMLLDRFVCTDDGLSDENVDETIRLFRNKDRRPITIGDVLKSHRLTDLDDPYLVRIRVNNPEYLRNTMSQEEFEQGMLVDVCRWNGTSLICNGDHWELTDRIYRYYRNPLTIWVI